MDEQDEHLLDLVDLNLMIIGINKIEVLKEIEEITALSFTEVNALVKNTPVTIKQWMPRRDAEIYVKNFEKLGARVTIVPSKKLVANSPQQVLNNQQTKKTQKNDDNTIGKSFHRAVLTPSNHPASSKQEPFTKVSNEEISALLKEVEGTIQSQNIDTKNDYVDIKPHVPISARLWGWGNIQFWLIIILTGGIGLPIAFMCKRIWQALSILVKDAEMRISKNSFEKN